MTTDPDRVLLNLADGLEVTAYEVQGPTDAFSIGTLARTMINERALWRLR